MQSLTKPDAIVWDYDTLMVDTDRPGTALGVYVKPLLAVHKTRCFLFVQMRSRFCCMLYLPSDGTTELKQEFSLCTGTSERQCTRIGTCIGRPDTARETVSNFLPPNRNMRTECYA
jgi:hypothetical protein